MTKTQQKQIDAAAARCRKAFKGITAPSLAWCCHHEVRIEALYQEAEARIRCILHDKSEHERVTRLNNFRPVKSKLPEGCEDMLRCEGVYYTLQKFGRKISLLHRKDVPNHTWKRGSIFGK